MNTKQLLAAIALITVSSSVLAETPFPPEVPFASTKTRAEVMAELAQAKAQGLMTVSNADYPPLPKFVSTKTRAEVKAELAQAKAQGLTTVSNADYGDPSARPNLVHNIE